MGMPKLWVPGNPVPKITFTDLHYHSEMSLKDGKTRLLDKIDAKHNKGEIILNAERRNTGAVTVTDHGNMYAHATLASEAKKYGLKHIPACEFYMAPVSRHNKSEPKGAEKYRHICGWAKDVRGYQNMCALSKLSFTEGFYSAPRIDKELIDKYGDGIIWSDACVGGTLSSLILQDRIEEAYSDFLWFLDRFKDDFYIEYQNHHMPIEDHANAIKIEWANKHGVAVIATTDAHYYKKEEKEAHQTLLCIQYADWLDNPMTGGFPGDGYWLMDDMELLERYPVEYLNNTQLIVDKVEGGIIKFGEVTPPKFQVPHWFKEMLEG